MRGVGERSLAEVHEYFPLRPSLADPTTRDLRGEVDPSFRRRLRAPAALLVPSLGGEQQDRFGRIDEHLTREDEILADPQPDAAEGGAPIVRVRERLAEGAGREI